MAETHAATTSKCFITDLNFALYLDVLAILGL